MSVIEMTGKTPEEAIEIALRELDVDRAEVEIDVVSRGKAGILGIGSEPARVRVTVLETPTDAVRVATDILDNLITKMGVSATINLKHAKDDDVGGPVFDVDGEDSGLLIGRRGETLRSLQYLVTSMASHRTGDKVNLFLDVSGYQERRYSSLTNMAKRIADRVSSSGQAVTMEPMPPNERRVVHMTLSDYPGVSTKSTGYGDQRQIVVTPN